MNRDALAHLIRHYTTRTQLNLRELERELRGIMLRDDRDFFLDYAWKFVRIPYVWGGDDPMRGFDCSGFVIECLKAVGKLPYEGDWTANAIWVLFQHLKVDRPAPGALVFWQSLNSGQMTHTEIVVHRGISLGASGGGSSTLTLADAIQRDAYIKARPFRGRDGRKLFFADPFKDE